MLVIPDDVAIAAFGKGELTPKQLFQAISASLTWHDLERLCAESDLPVLVKGVLTAEDAKLACEHGASGVVVPNPGGRQISGCPATVDVPGGVGGAVCAALGVRGAGVCHAVDRASNPLAVRSRTAVRADRRRHFPRQDGQ